MKKKIVVLSGAGMSAESGIQTFRGSGGMWEKYDIYQLATPDAWQKNPQLVQDFYNYRRKIVFEAQPNAGHIGLVELENDFDVQIITQNVDDLHERAGSSKVLHLHGEIKKARSTADPLLVYPMDTWELKMGDKCEKGSQLRPHIVWFGEAVPEIANAARLTATADIFVIIGTSLMVYPANGLIHNTPKNCLKFLIDPSFSEYYEDVEIISDNASVGVGILKEKLKNFI